MIDYEYGGANAAAYDIGNHFCEFAGLVIDYYDGSLYVFICVCLLDIPRQPTCIII